MEVFSKKLKERAAQLGISNAQAARLCGLDERRYANYTNDQREPDLNTLAKIARVLSTSVDYLLGLADPPTQTERTHLLDRLNVAAASLKDEELRTIVTQTEALAVPRPRKAGKKSP